MDTGFVGAGRQVLERYRTLAALDLRGKDAYYTRAEGDGAARSEQEEGDPEGSRGLTSAVGRGPRPWLTADSYPKTGGARSAAFV
jgi:hypothetical protein